MKTLMLTLAFVMLTGCDGIYEYSYEGNLYRNDGKPASYTPYDLSFAPTANARDPISGMTDTGGHFEGHFTRLTAWVFIVRPPPPTIEQLYLSTPASAPIKIKLNTADQVIDHGARHIVFPTVMLPP